MSGVGLLFEAVGKFSFICPSQFARTPANGTDKSTPGGILKLHNRSDNSEYCVAYPHFGSIFKRKAEQISHIFFGFQLTCQHLFLPYPPPCAQCLCDPSHIICTPPHLHCSPVCHILPCGQLTPTEEVAKLSIAAPSGYRDTRQGAVRT